MIFSAFAALTQQPRTVKLALETKQAAQAAQPPAAAKAAPVLSDKLKADYYKAQIHMKRAQEAVQAAQTEFQQMAAEFQKACGDGYEPQIDGNGDPICAVKAAAPAPATPDKK